jgi:CBS domain containing-hemolysin-like protein
VRGDLSVDDVNALFDLELPTDRADSIGGLMIDELGRIAVVGDQVIFGGVSLCVASMYGNSIEQLELRVDGGNHVD